MATTTPVTQEQLAATTRHIDTNGKPYYTVTSASDPTGFYTCRYVPQYRVLQCNCKAGRDGNCCWHKRAVLVAERFYQDMRSAKRIARERIEASTQYQAEQAEQALYTAQLNLAHERHV